jgi:hypothetical protein
MGRDEPPHDRDEERPGEEAEEELGAPVRLPSHPREVETDLRAHRRVLGRHVNQQRDVARERVVEVPGQGQDARLGDAQRGVDGGEEGQHRSQAPGQATLVPPDDLERGPGSGQLRPLALGQRRRTPSLELPRLPLRPVELLLQLATGLAGLTRTGGQLVRQRLGGEAELPDLVAHVLPVLLELVGGVLLG